MSYIGLVLNPAKVDDIDGLVDLVRTTCADRGWKPPEIRETSPEDPGAGMARELLDLGVDVVVAAGGDGTVRCVAQTLAGTGVRLGIVPAGTGNLLARNLDLPLDTDEAVPVALDGTPRTIDTAETSEGAAITVMAGIGFDAAMMRDVPEALKSSVGWPAYLVGGIRGLRRRRVRLSLVVDDAPPVRHVARTVLIGNCGTLQGGLALLPDARPDDGVLDVAVVAPTRPRDWFVLLWRATHGNRRHDHRLITYRGSHLQVRSDRVEPRQVDGDVIDDGRLLDVRIRPASLIVHVRPPEEQ